jgi:hypothetical protein
VKQSEELDHSKVHKDALFDQTCDVRKRSSE